MKYLIPLLFILFACKKEQELPVRNDTWCPWDEITFTMRTYLPTKILIEDFSTAIWTEMEYEYIFSYKAKEYSDVCHCTMCAVGKRFVVYVLDESNKWIYVGWGILESENIIEKSRLKPEFIDINKGK